ncbi:hypothetical protein WN55_00568 [Dufourea novaeangliae]|uniref:Uncharacterized protein n=1 Tax=Dufourea novaeangliae TaxID=178035 RepID=A0A154PDJ1_DUFNO|nr:hypothetical protein WN55_00568 [Dufourea novaeangliae]
MEGTWQWEQRKHCHIILLNPLSYVKENPEQAAGESFYTSRYFTRAAHTAGCHSVELARHRKGRLFTRKSRFSGKDDYAFLYLRNP